jgi:hypothetical protein
VGRNVISWEGTLSGVLRGRDHVGGWAVIMWLKGRDQVGGGFVIKWATVRKCPRPVHPAISHSHMQG